MTLPKRNRHLIVIDGVELHYNFHPHRLHGRESWVCVQDASGCGPLLKIQWIGKSVLPNLVETAVRYGMSQGWTPQSGTELDIGIDCRLDNINLTTKPEDGTRWWFYDEIFGSIMSE